MPKIRIEGYGNAGYRSNCTVRGLRDDIQQDRMDRDDCFDMYRNDIGIPSVKRAPVVRKDKKTNSDGPQLWFIASMISAFGMFCMFIDVLTIDEYVFVMRVTPFEMLIGSAITDITIPSCILYLSLMPLVFMVIFGLFAFLREKVFDKASLALIAVSVFVIVADFHWMKEISVYSATQYLVDYTAGLGVLIEMVCSIALIIVVVCKMILSHVWCARSSYSRW